MPHGPVFDRVKETIPWKKDSQKLTNANDIPFSHQHQVHSIIVTARLWRPMVQQTLADCKQPITTTLTSISPVQDTASPHAVWSLVYCDGDDSILVVPCKWQPQKQPTGVKRSLAKCNPFRARLPLGTSSRRTAVVGRNLAPGA